MPGITLVFEAIDRYYTLMLSDEPAARHAFAELQGWFASDDRLHPDAFERLCREYGIEPDAIRGMLQRRLSAAGRA